MDDMEPGWKPGSFFCAVAGIKEFAIICKQCYLCKTAFYKDNICYYETIH